jgi:plasmid stabilization system protein ParE
LSLRTFRVLPAAAEDLKHHADRFLAEAGADTALKFVDNARFCFTRLAEAPGMGAPINSRSRALAGIRKWHVDGFPKLLTFYVVGDHTIDIVRVLHAASDWHGLLDLD